MSPVTLRARTSTLPAVRESVTGSEEGAQLQMVDELKCTNRVVRQKILREAGITPEIQLGDGLAMKASLALPWRKLRHLRRYMYVHM